MTALLSDPMVAGFLVASILALMAMPIVWRCGYDRGRRDGREER